jgi:hypothetical protein
MSRFYAWLGKRKSSRIRLAVMDMWKPFRLATNVYPDSSIVRKTACHRAILGFVMGHDLRRLFVSR